MSLNGSGLYSPNTAGQPVVSGTTIDATVFNNLINDIATALSTAVFKDGQQTLTGNIPMGGFKLTGLATGTAITDSARVDNANALQICEFRLTGTTGVPVTTADVTAIETLYASPYRGNKIALYDGTNFIVRSSAEMSIDIPDATGVYDVFCYDNAGTPTLEVLAWTNDTTRATALTLQNGVLVKTGALTRRYLGTFYCTTAGNGQTEDSFANRYIWNYYNRICRAMRRVETTDTWSYSTAVWRQANGSTSNQLNFVIGYSEDAVSAQVLAMSSNSGTGGLGYVSVGLDVTNALTAGGLAHEVSLTTAAKVFASNASLKTYPGVGKHFLAWLENTNASGTTTWYGDSGGQIQAGIHGEIWG